MTLTTVQDLDALPAGSAIRVTDTTKAVWTKAAEGGWTRDGVPQVPSMFFAGLLEGGRVRDWRESDPEVGDVYQEGLSWYLFIYVNDEQTTFLAWRGQAFRQRYERSLSEVRGWQRPAKIRPENIPDWLQPLVAHVGVLQTMEASRRTTATSLLQAQEQSLQLQRELNAAVSTAERAEAERSQDRPGVVVVDVSATTEVPGEKAEGHVPEGAEVLSTTARWKVRLRYETHGIGCLCQQVTDQWVAEQIGVDAEVVYATDCGRH